MLSTCLFLESVIRRRDIAAGLGGNFGRYEGLLGGGGLGTLIGAKLSGISIEDLESGNFNNELLGPLIGAHIGAGLGMVAGGQLGRHIGKNVVSNPDAPADFSKASDRIGYLADPNTRWYGALSDLVAPGSAGVVGSLKNAISNDGAARLGYDNTGRVSQFLSGIASFGHLPPLMGFIKPPKKVKNK